MSADIADRDRRSECPYVTEDYILHLGRKLWTAIFGDLGGFPECVHCIIVFIAFSLRLRDDIGFCGDYFLFAVRISVVKYL